MAKNKKILVIDDSNTNIVLLEAILNTHGYKTVTAQSVKEAMPLIKNDPPLLILLDLLMPEISGFDFLKEIKSNDNLKNIPVIVVSALTDETNIERTLQLGAIDFIKKPVNLKSLVRIVENTLDGLN